MGQWDFGKVPQWDKEKQWDNGTLDNGTGPLVLYSFRSRSLENQTHDQRDLG